MGFGGSARGWKKDRIGVQLEVSRYSFDSADLLSRATTTETEAPAETATAPTSPQRFSSR